MVDKIKLTSFPNGHDIECPMCSSQSVVTRFESETFEYGSKKENAIKLTASIPVRTCNECGFEFTDIDAEDIRHSVVCKHLGRITPLDIRGLRKGYDLTRKKFSELTLLGEASLARWETGELIQNAAYDQFLYLLKFRDNIDRLYQRHSIKEKEYKEVETGVRKKSAKFRVLTDMQELTRKAKEFRLASYCLEA